MSLIAAVFRNIPNEPFGASLDGGSHGKKMIMGTSFVATSLPRSRGERGLVAE